MKTLFILFATLTLTFAPATLFAADETSPAFENNKSREAINSMQGKPAPALAVTQWINSRPLNLADLKGKIVVIDFWATYGAVPVWPPFRTAMNCKRNTPTKA